MRKQITINKSSRPGLIFCFNPKLTTFPVYFQK